MTRLGIVKTDKLKEEFVEQFGEYSTMFARRFEAIGVAFEWVIYDVRQGQYPDTIDEVDAYLITGSKASAYDSELWIDQLKVFVRELHAAEKKLIGICFGHQLIAEALGGKTEQSEEGWSVGVQKTQVHTVAQAYGLDADAYQVIASHQDVVTSPAKGADILASRPQCPVDAMGLGSHILSFQGHPEFDPSFMQQVLDMREDTLGEALHRQASNSLQMATDHLMVTRWIANFIQQ